MHNCNLTQREREVLQLTAYEHTSKEIAQLLFISRHTVISHRKNLYQKLGVSNIAGMIRMGFQMGLIPIKCIILVLTHFTINQSVNAQNTMDLSATDGLVLSIKDTLEILDPINGQLVLMPNDIMCQPQCGYHIMAYRNGRWYNVTDNINTADLCIPQIQDIDKDTRVRVDTDPS